MAKKRQQPQKSEPAELTPWEAYQAQQKQKQTKQKNSGSKRTIESKLPKLKEVRRKRLRRRLLVLIVILTVFLLGAGYFASPLSRVGTLNIEGKGQTTLSDQAVLDATGIKSNDLVIKTLWQRKQITQRALKKEAKLSSFQFKITNFHQLTLQYREHKMVGVLLQAGRYYPILSTGRITDDGSGKQSKSNYTVYSQFTPGSDLKAMVQQYNQSPVKIRSAISEIHFVPTKVNPQRIHLYMTDGNQVYATIKTFAKKMRYYPNIAKQMTKKGIINFEVGAYSYPAKS